MRDPDRPIPTSPYFTHGTSPRPPADKVGPNWVEISEGVMNDMRRRGEQREMFRQANLIAGNIGSPIEGHPVHFVNGKWYVEITPSNSRYIQEALRIEEVIEHRGPGTMHRDEMAARSQIWDGSRWFSVTDEQFLDAGVRIGSSHTTPFPNPMGEVTESKLSPAALQAVKDYLQTLDDEKERLQLRQLLAAQQDGDDEALGEEEDE